MSLRVGLIIYGRLDTLSGGYLYDRRLVAHLQQAGDQVEVISLPWSSYAHHLLHNFSPGLRQRLRTASYDVLLQDELNHPSLFLLNGALRQQVTYPIISIVHHLRGSEHHPWWLQTLYGAIEKKYLQSVDGYVFNSETTRKAVGAQCGHRPGQVAFPAGDQFQPEITPAQITVRAHTPGPLRLVFVGNLIRRKNLHTLLAALATLPRDSWQLQVIGNMAVSPGYTRTIQRQIQAQQLDKHVQLRGILTTDLLAQELGASHVLAVPSLYEGFGIVYLEGMGFGLPALAGGAGASHEIVTHGRTGFLSSDGSALAQQIQTLHENRNQLAAMSLAARRRYQTHPTWEETAAHIRDFLVQMTGNG